MAKDKVSRKTFDKEMKRLQVELCAHKLEWSDGSVEEYTTEETDML